MSYPRLNRLFCDWFMSLPIVSRLEPASKYMLSDRGVSHEAKTAIKLKLMLVKLTNIFGVSLILTVLILTYSPHAVPRPSKTNKQKTTTKTSRNIHRSCCKLWLSCSDQKYRKREGALARGRARARTHARTHAPPPPPPAATTTNRSVATLTCRNTGRVSVAVSRFVLVTSIHRLQIAVIDHPLTLLNLFFFFFLYI